MTTSPQGGPPLEVEVEGSFACFTRPEFKTERLSYPVMTPSAAIGLLEAIFWKPEFSYRVQRIEVLNPIRWFSIRRNEVDQTTSGDWARRAMADPATRFDAEANRDQRHMKGLRDVAYRIFAHMDLHSHADAHPAKYRDQFRRRVERGACFSQPFLGTREFSASFAKPGGRAPIPDTEELGVMLHSIDYSGKREIYHWFQASMVDGVITVPEHGAELPGSPPGRTGGRG